MQVRITTVEILVTIKSDVTTSVLNKRQLSFDSIQSRITTPKLLTWTIHCSVGSFKGKEKHKVNSNTNLSI